MPRFANPQFENKHWKCPKCGGVNGDDREKCLECGEIKTEFTKSKIYPISKDFNQ